MTEPESVERARRILRLYEVLTLGGLWLPLLGGVVAGYASTRSGGPPTVSWLSVELTGAGTVANLGAIVLLVLHPRICPRIWFAMNSVSLVISVFTTWLMVKALM